MCSFLFDILRALALLFVICLFLPKNTQNIYQKLLIIVESSIQMRKMENTLVSSWPVLDKKPVEIRRRELRRIKVENHGENQV